MNRSAFIERIFSSPEGFDLAIIGGGANGSGVGPYLPLDQLRRPSGSGSGSGNGASQTDNTNRSNMTTGGNN